MHLLQRSMTANNLAAVYAVFILSALGGSVMTVLLAGSAIWALFYTAIGRVKPRFDGGVRILTAAILVYVGINTLFFLVNYGATEMSPTRALGKLAPQLLFVGAILLMWRLALSRGDELLRVLWRGAAIGAIVVTPLAVYQLFALGLRAEGGSGNAIPFSLICAFLSLASLMGLLDKDKRYRILAAAGFACATFCIFLAQTKGLMPVPIFGVLVFLAIFYRKRLSLVQMFAVLVSLAVLTAAGLYMTGSYKRFQSMVGAIENSDVLLSDASYSHRLNLWQHAVPAILEHPLTGHGVQNRGAVIESFGYRYSHLHNGFLTALIDNGVIGLVSLLGLLCAPLLIAFKTARDRFWSHRLFLAFALVLTYAMGGMTNFIFGHDIYDSLFLWVAAIIAVSATPERKADEFTA